MIFNYFIHNNDDILELKSNEISGTRYEKYLDFLVFKKKS